MRRTFDDRPKKDNRPSNNFFVKVFERKYAIVVVDCESNDVHLILELQRGEQYHSVKKFISQPAVGFPVWARKKCLELFFYYFN